MSTHDLAVFAIVVGLRVVVPLFIPRWPLPAILAALVIDGVDQTVFQTFTSANLDGYQSYDKALDIYYLSVAFLSTYRNWANLTAVSIAAFLYFFRLIGVSLFESLQVRALLLLFPNTFEYFFIFVEAVRTRWDVRRMTPVALVTAMWAIWVFIKVPQEYWIHVAQLDVTDAMKTRLFGATLDTPWSAIFADAWPSIVAALLGVAFLAHLLRANLGRRLPPADWPLTFDANAHNTDVTPEEVRAAARRSAERFWDGELLEKTAMVALLCAIFSSILPGLNASPLWVAVGTGLVVLLNTAASELLIRRGFEASTMVAQLVVMLLLNVAIVFVFNLLPGPTAPLNSGHTIFFLLLLSLIVTMHDRFRPWLAARRVKQGLAPA